MKTRTQITITLDPDERYTVAHDGKNYEVQYVSVWLDDDDKHEASYYIQGRRVFGNGSRTQATTAMPWHKPRAHVETLITDALSHEHDRISRTLYVRNSALAATSG